MGVFFSPAPFAPAMLIAGVLTNDFSEDWGAIIMQRNRYARLWAAIPR